MQSHFDGEVWGLDLINDGKHILTCADDNKFMLINTESKSVEREGKISEKKTAAKSDKKKMYTASSMGVYKPV